MVGLKIYPFLKVFKSEADNYHCVDFCTYLFHPNIKKTRTKTSIIDTPKRMLERRERKGEREGERERKKGRRIDIEREGEIREIERERMREREREREKQRERERKRERERG